MEQSWQSSNSTHEIKSSILQSFNTRVMKMDLEAAKDDLSVEDGSLLVFTDITFVTRNKNSTFWRKDKDDSELAILRGASGAIRPGRLTFILGPSGAGKTTLLKILAGRKKTGVSGSLQGAGRNAVLVPQHTSLIDPLTAEETLRFAASLKLPNSSRRDQNYVIQSVSTQLGIHEILNTRAGQLSGGERKRLAIACELLTDPSIMLLDEPTSGLDSVSSLSVARALLALARGGRTVACVIHQPSSRLFSCADDVILLDSGRTLYAGAAADMAQILASADFVCPIYYNMADYLLEIATGEQKGNLPLLSREVDNYACEMRRIVRNEVEDKNEKGVPIEAEALLRRRSREKRGYKASFFQQLQSLLWRCYICALRDVHLSQIRLVAHFVVALLLGALYSGAGAAADRMISNTGCIFFFLLFLFFSNAMPTIHSFPAESTVVLQEHLNKWYSVFTYCISKLLVDLPGQLLCATAFLFPAWYLTSQPLDYHRMTLAWTVCVLVTILAQTFGMVVGAAFDVKMGLFVIPAANIPMLMFSEFFIPYREMPVYLRPFATISYFRYAFDAILQTVYGFDRPKLPCHEAFCMFKVPKQYLGFLGVPQDYLTDVLALVVWIVLLQISLVCVMCFRVYRACK